MSKSIIISLTLLLTMSLANSAPPDAQKLTSSSALGISDISNDVYIDANNILMFITNHGNFGRDLAGVFGYDFGSFFPYDTPERILSGELNMSVLYAGGIWLGGLVSGETRVAIAEFDDEYVPGPMANGTFQTNRPEFRVYKLYRDSMAGNPNIDWLEWPIDQGAPVDSLGHPAMLGDQMVWSVFNDADPAQHANDAGFTPPLGIEVQQTVWACDDYSVVDTAWITSGIEGSRIGGTGLGSIEVHVADPAALTGHVYHVIIEEDSVLGTIWKLIDFTLAATLLDNQTGFSDNSDPIYIDGFVIQAERPISGFSCFEVAANGDGPLDPPEAGAAEWWGFPVPHDSLGNPTRPTDSQQVGDGRWLFHTADNGGTSGGGTRADYDTFVSRVTRDGLNLDRIGMYDYEMRFTGVIDSSSGAIDTIGGGFAIEYWNEDNVFWVPFELWRTGRGFPDDPSDQLRLVPFVIDGGADNMTGDDIFALENWGTPANGGDDLEHSVSGLDDDPFTDWVYWFLPSDTSPGQAGYFANESQMLAGTFDTTLIAGEIMARTVLVNWNGGAQPPFTQDVPEQGTIFRIETTKEPADTMQFTASPPATFAVGGEGNAVYMKYKLYNEGPNQINDFYISIWLDPDLGQYWDDLVGCDTLDDIFYVYNRDPDAQYGYRCPAAGFKVLVGPLVSSGADTALFDGNLIVGYRNMSMTAFNKWINGTDPDNFSEVYNYMQGLQRDGSPYIWDSQSLRFMHSGDPVTGSGDLDFNGDDRRLFASFGPLTFAPGDSQFVLLKYAVGQGTDPLSSITKLKEILNAASNCEPVDCCIGMRGDANYDGLDAGILDIVYIVDELFRGGPRSICPEETDLNLNGISSEVIDLVYLVDYVFRGGPIPPDCPN